MVPDVPVDAFVVATVIPVVAVLVLRADTKVPLYADGVAPAMVTLSFTDKPCPAATSAVAVVLALVRVAE